MEIALTTLTPIWTGNIDKSSINIIENGILGSIRWWAEAINRGSDYTSCDPTNDDYQCPQNINNRNKYCLSCFIFGATGKRRLFKIQLEGGDSLFQQYIQIKPNRRNRGWYYPGSGIMGDISIKIIPLNRIFKNEYVTLPVSIASKLGGIGAKNQLGYGVSNLNKIPDININEYFNSELKHNPNIRKNVGNQSRYPNLKDMFFAKINFKVNSQDWWKKIDGIKNNPKLWKKNEEYYEKWIEQGTIPIYPAIKNWLRYREGKNLWNTNNNYQNQRIENFLLGTIKECCPKCFTSGNGLIKDRYNSNKRWCKNCRESISKNKILDKIASKIYVSFAYRLDDYSKWEFRIWGWIPISKNSPLMGRDQFLDRFKNCLNDDSNTNKLWKKLLGSHIENLELVSWREYNSSRDNLNQIEDYYKYIGSLISEKGGA